MPPDAGGQAWDSLSSQAEKEPALPTPQCRLSPPDCEDTRLWFQAPCCGILLQQPQKMNTFIFYSFACKAQFRASHQYSLT